MKVFTIFVFTVILFLTYVTCHGGDESRTGRQRRQLFGGGQGIISHVAQNHIHRPIHAMFHPHEEQQSFGNNYNSGRNSHHHHGNNFDQDDSHGRRRPRPHSHNHHHHHRRHLNTDGHH